MKIRATLVTVWIGMLCIVSSLVSAAVIFSDSFESGDFSATNADGFRWEYGGKTTSIVTQNPKCGGLSPNTPTIVYGTKIMCDGSQVPAGGGDWSAKDGNYSLRFLYPPGQSWTELRFDLGKPRRELWIRYWLRVPTNFTYGPGRTRNNKFFAIWMDRYETKGDGSTVWLGMDPYNNTGATLGFTYSDGKYKGSEGYKQHTPFITTADRGKWMQIILHVKAESSPGASDGIVQTFRRWAGESKFTKLHETLKAPLRVPDSGPNGFTTGYILGWANAPYTQRTEWLLDDFTISTTPLLTILTPKSPTSLLAQ